MPQTPKPKLPVLKTPRATYAPRQRVPLTDFQRQVAELAPRFRTANGKYNARDIIAAIHGKRK
ncbi:MAG: hypothetical protein Q8R15_00685, partial [Candidatus Micrarchaeota archaeon]|nr:hypothetical protein [Candidatus Micrarchaeota archaeon]